MSFLYTMSYLSVILKLAITVWGLPKTGFLAQKFNRITAVEPCTSAQLKNFSPAFGKPLCVPSMGIWYRRYQIIPEGESLPLPVDRSLMCGGNPDIRDRLSRSVSKSQ